MQMTYEQAMRPGMLLAFANRRGSGYMMRSERRNGSYGNGSKRRPPRKRAGFLYIFLTLLLCVILWPVGVVMLWRRKVRLQPGTKLLISLFTLCLSVFLIVFALTVPVNNPEFTAFQDRANDWLDQAAANVAAAGDAAYKKGAETWSVMSDFGKAATDYTLVHGAQLCDKGVELAGQARSAVVGLFHREDEGGPAGTPEATVEAPELTDAPEITEAPRETEATVTAAFQTEAPTETDEAKGLDIHLPEESPDPATAQVLESGALHSDGSFTPDEGEATTPVETAQPETWTAVEDVTEAPTEEPTEEPTEAPTEEPAEETAEALTEETAEAPTEEPTEEPTEAPTEEPAEETAEAPAEAPTEAPTKETTEAPTEEPAEETAEAPTEETAEAATEEPAEAPAEAVEETAKAPEEAEGSDAVMAPVEPTPEATAETPASTGPQVKPAREATVYYFDNGSKGFHIAPNLHGMNNAPAHSLAEAFADGKTPCRSCGMPDKSILDEPWVAWLDAGDKIHTTDECPAFEGNWRLVPLAEAVEAGYARCADCQADVYAEAAFPSPTQTPAPEVVTPSTPLKSVGEIAVYYFDSSRSYHAAPNCKGMSNAPSHTLAEAVADGKRTCGNCHPVSAELIGLPVLWLDEAGTCHTTDNCSSFTGQFSLVERDDALEQGLAACTDCGAAEYLIPGTVLSDN